MMAAVMTVGQPKGQSEEAGARAPASLPGEFCRIVNYPRGEFAGAHAVQHVHPHTLDVSEDTLRESCAGAEAQAFRAGSQQPADAYRQRGPDRGQDECPERVRESRVHALVHKVAHCQGAGHRKHDGQRGQE